MADDDDYLDDYDDEDAVEQDLADIHQSTQNRHCVHGPALPDRVPRQSSKRPGQMLPRPNRGACFQPTLPEQQPMQPPMEDNDQPMHDELSGDEQQQDEQQEQQQANPSATSSSRSKPDQQYHDWSMKYQNLRGLSLRLSPMLASLAARRQQQQQLELQALASEAWRFHSCCSTQQEFSDSMLTVAGSRDVVLFALSHRCCLKVPKWHCQQCQQTFEPEALTVGCWPSTAAEPHVWYDSEVMRVFSHLALRDGLSATGTRAGDAPCCVLCRCGRLAWLASYVLACSVC